jgi:DeoR family transcriptional regulator, suf operon transcriptional repressor
MAIESHAGTSDVMILDLLRKRGALSVVELADLMGVTATAVRQRLVRLMAQRLIERQSVRAARGRPGHRYSLTERGRRQSGSNFADLAIALWDEIRAIEDPVVKRGLLQRLAKRLAGVYAERFRGTSLAERLEALRELFGERNVKVTVDQNGNNLPVLTVVECPYPELAEQDRGICALERMLFSELLERGVKLSDCRLDGSACCTFEMN